MQMQEGWVVNIHYKIVAGITAKELEQRVNSNLECGFILVGELVVHDSVFYQVMIYYSENDTA